MTHSDKLCQLSQKILYYINRGKLKLTKLTEIYVHFIQQRTYIHTNIHSYMQTPMQH